MLHPPARATCKCSTLPSLGIGGRQKQLRFILSVFMYVMCVYMCVCVQYTERPAEYVRLPEAVVRGNCEFAQCG